MKQSKLLKARKRRKDFEKKRNVKNNNWSEADNKNSRLKAGDGVLPDSEKNRLSKRQIAHREKLRRNAISTINNT